MEVSSHTHTFFLRAANIPDADANPRYSVPSQAIRAPTRRACSRRSPGPGRRHEHEQVQLRNVEASDDVAESLPRSAVPRLRRGWPRRPHACRRGRPRGPGQSSNERPPASPSTCILAPTPARPEAWGAGAHSRGVSCDPSSAVTASTANCKSRSGIIAKSEMSVSRSPPTIYAKVSK